MSQISMRMMRLLCMLMWVSSGSLAYAEQAPVYDADGLSGGDGYEQAVDVMPPSPESTMSGSRHRTAAEIPYSAPRQSLDQRVKQLEQNLSTIKSSGSTAKLEAFQNEMQQLRGQVEQLTYELNQLKTQHSLQYADLEKRLGRGNANVTPAMIVPKKTAETKKKTSVKSPEPIESITNADEVAPVAAKKTKPEVKKIAQSTDETNENESTLRDDEEDNSGANNGATDDDVSTDGNNAVSKAKAATENKKSEPQKALPAENEQKLFQTAFDHVKEKEYPDAVVALEKMLSQYPNGQFAPSGYSLLGNLHGSLRHYPQALKSYQSLISQFPNHAKVQDAYYKTGMIYAAQFKWNEARAAFKKVIARYPNSQSAKLAKEQLKQIKLTGN